MTNDIGNIIIGKIQTLPFIHKYAGVVRSLSFTESVEGKSIKKIFPASAQITLEQCQSGKYRDLCLDSGKKSVLYLEDMGARFLRSEGALNYFNARFQLVCWLNLPLLGYSSTEYSSIAIQGILSRFSETPFNSGIFNRIKINVNSQLPKSVNPFQKYSYDENVNQFLIYPFDYFVLELDVDYVVNKRCLEEQEVDVPIGCEPQAGGNLYVNILNQDGEVIATVSCGQSYTVTQLTTIVQNLGDPVTTIVQEIPQ